MILLFSANTGKCGTLDVTTVDLSEAVENVSLNTIERSDMIKEEESNESPQMTEQMESQNANSQPSVPVSYLSYFYG